VQCIEYNGVSKIAMVFYWWWSVQAVWSMHSNMIDWVIIAYFCRPLFFLNWRRLNLGSLVLFYTSQCLRWRDY